MVTEQANQPVRVVISGGPRAGKTTIARTISRDYSERIAVLPETATMLFQGGFPRPQEENGQLAVQRAIFSVQRQVEQITHLNAPEKIQLCDRSTLDGGSYWPGGLAAFLNGVGTTLEEEYARYSRVILLKSSAWLPGEYTTSGSLRTESPQRARELDEELERIYEGHPDLIKIPAYADFSVKVQMVVDHLEEVLDRQKFQVET